MMTPNPPSRHDSNRFSSLKTVSIPSSCKLVDAEHSLYLLEDDGLAGTCGHVPVYVQFFSTTNFYGLGDFLRRFDERLGFEVEGCGKGWVKWYCREGGGHLLLRRRLCRHRNFCPNDAEAYVRLRVNRAWKIIKEFANSVKFGVYVIHIVFTFPREIWRKGVEDPSLLAKCVYGTLKQYKGGMFGGVLGIHLWHSKKPQSGWYPHVHVLLLNAVLNRLPQLSGDGIKLSKKKKGCNFYFKRKRPFFNNKLLKIRFKWAIKEVFGYEWIGLPDVYCQYYKVNDENKCKIKHKLRYVFRLPIQDFDKVDFSKLDDVEAKFVWELLNFRFKRVRWFGFLADGVKKRYLAVAGVKFERLEFLLMLLKRESSICPLHGVKMVRVGDYGAG
jgi:hypothetical protein